MNKITIDQALQIMTNNSYYLIKSVLDEKRTTISDQAKYLFYKYNGDDDHDLYVMLSDEELCQFVYENELN